MNHEPRSVVHMEKQLWWLCKLHGTESLGISQVGQTVLARLIESHIWHQPAISGALLGEGSEGQWLLPTLCVGESCPRDLTLMPYTSVSPCMPLVPFMLLLSAGAQRERIRISLCVSSLRGTSWDSRSFFNQLNSRWFLLPEVMGTYLPSTGSLD